MRTGAVKLHDVLQVNYRADASYHLSEGRTVKRYIAHSPYPLTTIGEVSKRIFYGNRARRVYVSDKEHGIPFLSSSDIMQADLDHVKLASKKYTPDVEGMVLQKGWILISRSGTVGNCAFASRLHAQKLASEHVIGLVPDYILRPGLIYAYLASKYGHSLLTQGVFGAVIQHIEPAFIASLPIPMFPQSFQTEVDNLIQESARLREEANDKLEEAKSKLIEFCNLPFSKNYGIKNNSIKISNIRKTLNTRFDPPIYINDGVDWMNSLKKETILLGDIDVKTWYPGIFKRIYVKKGLPYIKGSFVFNINPFKSCDHLSITRTPMLDELWLKDGLLLITCAGTVGLVKIITKEYEDKGAIGSPDIIRLTSNDKLFTTEYLFTYLQLPAVYDYMQSLKYGSVIERFDIANVDTIPIVKPTISLSREITELINAYKNCKYHAFNAEEKAMKMVEDEIEKWNKAN